MQHSHDPNVAEGGGMQTALGTSMVAWSSTVMQSHRMLPADTSHILVSHAASMYTSTLYVSIYKI